jgi:polysaccharide pyruvyl transferase CsaB
VDPKETTATDQHEAGIFNCALKAGEISPENRFDMVGLCGGPGITGSDYEAQITATGAKLLEQTSQNRFLACVPKPVLADEKDHLIQGKTLQCNRDVSFEGLSRVVIAGYYGAGNAGDEAILAGVLTILRRRMPGLNATVISADPAHTAAHYGVAAIFKSDKPAIIAAVRDCDLVVLGGGGLLHDHWPMDIGNLFADPAAHISYPAYAALAALFNKPLELFAIGVGPLTTSAGRQYTRMVCDQAQAITVRDAESKALLEELGVDSQRIALTPDPAFLLTAPTASLQFQRPVLGVALRNWNTNDWEAETAAALDEFLNRRGGSVLLLPFERSTDTEVANSVRSRMRFQDRAHIFCGAGDPAQLAGAIGSTDVVLGMRYHSVLFAMRQGVPVVGLAYDPKVRRLLRAAGAEEYAIELNEIRTPDLIARIESAMDDAGLRSRLRSAADEMAEQAARLEVTWTNSPAPATAVRAWLDELTAADPDPEIRESIAHRRAELSGPLPYDIVCFPGIEWNFRWMRAQQLLSQFADRGHRVFFVSSEKVAPHLTTRLLRANVREVQLAAPTPLDVYSGVMSEEHRRATVASVTALAHDFGVRSAVLMLHLATWTPAALYLRTNLGWPLVYDCMDDWSGFGWMPDAMLDRERELVQKADVVVVTAQKLWDKWSSLTPRTILARNAADIAHFQHPDKSQAEIDLPASQPVVGFFGAIDSWFDVDLVRAAALARPEYFFALLGAVYDAPVDRLGGLPNVRLYGPQPYSALPAWLERFDACIIPFKINQVTEATDPVKFYEYLAQAKPVVATRLPELERYRELLYLAGTSDEFVRALDTAVAERDPALRERRLQAANQNTWAARYEVIDAAIEPAITPRRRILFACPVLILGGVEVILKSRIAELERRGWQVRLAAMEEHGGRALFEASGLDVRVCPDEASFARELDEFQPDWVVILDAPAFLPPARAAARRVIYEVHSTYPHILAPLVDRQFLNGVSGIIVPSPSQERRVQALVADPLPIEVVPNVLAPEFCETISGETISGTGYITPKFPIVLWVGRLDAVKNWRAFLEMVAQLRDQTDAEFHFLSAGPLTEADATEVEIAVAALEGRLHWIREVEHARMPDVYRTAAASGGCMISTSTAESFGMAALEAMACGCPVVAPDIEGLRDLIRHGDTGLLYPSGDIVAACEQVLTMLQDNPENRHRITSAAHDFACQFQPAEAVERFLAILEKWSSTETAPETPPLPDTSNARRVIIFPPSLPWTSAGRPQRWARTFASLGCVVFYCDPQHTGDAYAEMEPRIFVANVRLAAFATQKDPVLLLYSYNVDQLQPIEDAPAIFEYLATGETPTPVEQEWLARATVVTVASEEAHNAVRPWRPDAILAPDSQNSWDSAALSILDALKKPAGPGDHPGRLKALLRWRESQVARLEAQIRDRDRPAVDILHGAVTEQKRILSERDKGIAFLRGEVAHRDHVIASQQEALSNLQRNLAAVREEREQETASLRQDISALQAGLANREEGIEFLQRELENRDVILRSRDEGIEFLRKEIANLTESLHQLEAMLPWWRKRKQ